MAKRVNRIMTHTPVAAVVHKVTSTKLQSFCSTRYALSDFYGSTGLRLSKTKGRQNRTLVACAKRLDISCYHVYASGKPSNKEENIVSLLPTPGGGNKEDFISPVNKSSGVQQRESSFGGREGGGQELLKLP